MGAESRAIAPVRDGLLSFIKQSPTSYHAVAYMCARLDEAGFSRLEESASWHVERGGSYYVVRNDSSIVAFRVGERACDPRILMAASHCDSPALRVKAQPLLKGPGAYTRLNVEVYGGAIDRTWLDRPLTMAGRVLYESSGHIERRLIHVDKDLFLIPSLAVHLNREVNKEGGIDRRVDLCPLVSAGDEGTRLEQLVAEELQIEPEQILGWDLSIVNRQEPIVWGACEEFVSAPRLDDLQCAYSSLRAFIATDEVPEDAIVVHACMDNEEVGSGTMQGALSTLLPDVLTRVCGALGGDDECYRRTVARSFMVSCDNAHAVHPNHPEPYDEGNRCWMNGGVVFKEAANQRYATDGVSRAFFKMICNQAGVPTQVFANRSDLLGGSTLGNLALRKISMHTVDVGLAQLAMHSAYETAGVLDTEYLARALRALFSTNLML